MARERRTRKENGDALWREAIEELGGPALVLDRELRVVAVTPGAERLVGGPVPLGTVAPKVLCGGAVERPVAEAMASGRAVSASVPRPGPGGKERLLEVRAVPMVRGGARVGWLLLLSDQGVTEAGAAVCFHGMWSRDPAMRRLFQVIEKVAPSDASVLVRGDTGSGKELVASAIHEISPRREGPFRAINCAALPPALLESELFGHARGAFTGAVRDNPGHFRLADGGTLFLDEVAEMPLDLQAKLLRVLETRSVIPVGGREPVPVDVRIVSATHRALRREVSEGRFRADLMYRLRVVPVFLPPLRARRGDVALLVDKRIEELNARGGRRISRVAPGALAILEKHDWPGNVRELRNVLEYVYVIGEGAVLVEADLPPELLDPDWAFDEAPPPANRPPSPSPSPPASAARSPEAERISRALERSGGSRERAANVLGISRATLWRRMREHGLIG